MDAQEYVKSKIAEALAGFSLYAERIHHIRQPQADEKGGVDVPAVIWRQDGTSEIDAIEGVSDPYVRFFNIESRASPDDGGEYAQNISTAIMRALGDRVSHILADFDEPYDYSQQRGNYVAHIIEVGISE